MWVTMGNVWAHLTRYTQEERKWLDEYLTYKNDKAFFTKGPPTLSMFDWKQNAFPAGLLATIKKDAQAEGFTVEVSDPRTDKVLIEPKPDLAWLRWYQLEAVRRSCAAERGILWLPTGAGKTEVAVGLTRAMPGRWLFIVHRWILARQAAERWELRTPGQKAGRIGDGNWDADWDRHTFIAATFQTLSARLKAGDPATLALLSGATRLIVDEAHTLPSDTASNVAQALVNARVRIGLSGTPLAREDKRSLVAIASLGGVIYRLRAQTLIEEGVLARPMIRALISREQVDAVSWEHCCSRGITRSAYRNRVVLAAAKMAEHPTLIFVKEVPHGRALEKMATAGGLRAKFVHGEMKQVLRDQALAQLAYGDLDAVICTVVFNEGVDIPGLRSVVIASGGQSVIQAIQRVGRGMRVSEGKTDFTAYDIRDVGCGCLSPKYQGLRHTGCKWLAKHSKARFGAYVAEGYTVADEEVGFAPPAPRDGSLKVGPGSPPA